MSVNKFLGAAKEFMHESHVSFWQDLSHLVWDGAWPRRDQAERKALK